MKKYGVTMTYYKYVEVEAKNEKEARQKAHAGETISEQELEADDESMDEVVELSDVEMSKKESRGKKNE